MFNWFKKKKETPAVEESNNDYVDCESVEPTNQYSEELAKPAPTPTTNFALTVENVGSLANNVISNVDSALATVNSVGTTLKETAQVVAQVKYDIAKLDHDLDMFIADSNMRLEKFKTAMPVLNEQLTFISERLDNITDKMMENVMDPKDPNSIQKHSMMMDMLTTMNDSFNNMLVKLITI